MKKIVTIVGARPQFIKAAVTSLELRKKFTEILVHTGQHYDVNMSEVFFEEMKIPKPNYNLSVGSGSHAVQTANMMIKIEEVLLSEKPDGVLLYGDTNSTVAASIVAAKLNIPIFHVEAGTRTFIFDMPEEQNRIITDHLSSICFAPTALSYENLVNEGLQNKSVFVGDVMYDALLYYSKIAEEQTDKYYIEKLIPLFKKNIKETMNSNYILATSHRPENTDDKKKFNEILKALNCMEKVVLFPVHPRIRKYIQEVNKLYPNICFVEPLSYFETLHFLKNADFVVTDSGGLHKEAYLMGIPCTSILRNGWEETVNGGWNQFVQPNCESILKSILNRDVERSCDRNQFGDGDSCKKISEQIENFFKENH